MALLPVRLSALPEACAPPLPNKQVVGILSERDYLKKIAVQGRSSQTTAVREIMTGRSKMITVSSIFRGEAGSTLEASARLTLARPLVSQVEPKTAVLDAMSLMIRANIRHLPVVGPGPVAAAGSLGRELSLFPLTLAAAPYRLGGWGLDGGHAVDPGRGPAGL